MAIVGAYVFYRKDLKTLNKNFLDLFPEQDQYGIETFLKDHDKLSEIYRSYQDSFININGKNSTRDYAEEFFQKIMYSIPFLLIKTDSLGIRNFGRLRIVRNILRLDIRYTGIQF